MIILISPAKRQAGSGEGSLLPACAEATEAPFQREAEELREKLSTLSESELASLFSLSEKKARELYQVYQENLVRRRALDLFRGPAFGALLGDGVPAGLCDTIGSSLRILSGLYGMLRPFDAVASHRLDLEHRLPGFHTPNLYEFWRDKVTELLLREEALREEPLLLDLASKEYSTLIDSKRLEAAGVSRIAPDFVTLRDGKERRLSVYTKQGRGGLARYLLARRAEDTGESWDLPRLRELLSRARWDGFELDREGTSVQRPRFVKPA